jgi:endonuclease/exonuclease/phosphatase family metal-dependent hydrolase
LATVSLAACGLPAAGAARPAPDLRRDSTELAVLSYNVKSLPSILGGWNKGARLQRIRSRVDRYDVAFFQEAFTSVPNLLAGLDTRGAVVSEHFGPAVRPVGARQSTGLAMAIFKPMTVVGAPHIGHYVHCSGTFTRANDCLASKGFTMQRVRFNGIEIDLYGTHLDADSADAPVRLLQLNELAAALQQLSAGRPIIMAGDFNVERRDSTEFQTLLDFATRAGLTDAGAMVGAEWPERIDYIFFRGSPEVMISLRHAGDDPSFRHGTTHLSDHPAVFAILGVQPLASK